MVCLYIGNKGVLKINRKTPPLESLFNKVAGLLFSSEIYQIFNNTYFDEHIWMTVFLTHEVTESHNQSNKIRIL